MAYENILFEVNDNIATITINRPDRLNACSIETADEMVDALGNLGGVRAVVLTGTGRAFCSGADLQASGGASILSSAGVRDGLALHYNPLILKLSSLAVPVVSAVNGLAAGIGCSIALAADFAIAARSAYFLQAFVNIGLIPDGGASWILPRLVGRQRAMELMMLGERLDAEKAVEWGLIYRAVDDDALAGEARALAARLAAGPTRTLGIMRRIVAQALQSDYAATLAMEAEGQGQAFATADAVEGARAFLEKRKPRFTGQ